MGYAEVIEKDVNRIAELVNRIDSNRRLTSEQRENIRTYIITLADTLVAETEEFKL